jgi:hypothetical protein
VQIPLSTFSYKVLGQHIPDIPVFTVQREDGEGRKRNLHRNLLLSVGDISETPVKPVPKPRVRTLKPKSPQIRPALIDTEDESSDEEPIELVVALECLGYAVLILYMVLVPIYLQVCVFL